MDFRPESRQPRRERGQNGDHLDSVRDAVDNGGVVRIHRAYDAYGNITSEELRNGANQVVQPGQLFALEELFAFTARPFDSDRKPNELDDS